MSFEALRFGRSQPRAETAGEVPHSMGSLPYQTRIASVDRTTVHGLRVRFLQDLTTVSTEPEGKVA